MSIEIFSRPRQGGKTYTTLNWFCADPDQRMIVTITEHEAERLRREAVRMLVPPGNPGQREALKARFRDSIISWRSLDRNRGAGGRQVRIDNADMILREMVGHHNDLNGVTWNG